MKGQYVGYVRVSTLEQNEQRQLEGMREAGIELDMVFTDKSSGKDTKRTALNECLTYLRKGDVLCVHSIDRLARNLRDLQSLIADLTQRNVSIRFIKENMFFDGNGPNSVQTLTFQIMGAFAEFERNLIRERQQEGIALVKAKGGKMGRGKAMTPEQDQEVLRRVKNGETVINISKELGISRATIYRHLNALRNDC